MKLVSMASDRIASASAAALGIAGVLYLAVTNTEPPGPETVLAIAGALAPTLAILVAWWIPSRALRVAMLVVAMLLELPALVISGSGLALCVEMLLFVAVVATPLDRPARPHDPRNLSIVF
jgi:hypothetical protein